MTQFDTLYSKYFQQISEDMPVSLEPGIAPGASERAPATFTDTANYKITPEQVVSVIDSVIDYLQTRNGYSPLPYKDFQKMVMADKIVALTPLNPTKAVYAARVVYNAMKDAGFITDEKSGGKKGITLDADPAAEDVEEVAAEVAAEVAEDGHAAPEKEKIDIDDDEVTAFFKSADFPVEEVTPEEEEELHAAWSAIPDDKDIEWSDLCKLVGMSTATKLKEIQAILPSESASKEEEGSPFIEDDEQIDDEDLTDTDRVISRSEVEREISPSFRFSGSPYRDIND